MKIMTLQGTDKLLYELVAPLVMNPAILRQNNNYPFKTSRSHVWYIAFHETAVVGSSQASLMAVVHKRHVKVFSQKKFQTCVEWKNYDKMHYLPEVES